MALERAGRLYAPHEKGEELLPQLLRRAFVGVGKACYMYRRALSADAGPNGRNNALSHCYYDCPPRFMACGYLIRTSAERQRNVLDLLPIPSHLTVSKVCLETVRARPKFCRHRAHNLANPRRRTLRLSECLHP